ncbi:MAG: triose-phosphate isomerase, partial [Yoonia sp.]|uniref:triose-phosphate isomerase n=1 Tax=Yoonia sp. TaxID=2212373 RepID=UPI003EF92E28
MRKLIAGNWKMNGTSADLAQLETLAKSHCDANVDVLICGPATLLNRMAQSG